MNGFLETGLDLATSALEPSEELLQSRAFEQRKGFHDGEFDHEIKKMSNTQVSSVGGGGVGRGGRWTLLDLT